MTYLQAKAAAAALTHSPQLPGLQLYPLGVSAVSRAPSSVLCLQTLHHGGCVMSARELITFRWHSSAPHDRVRVTGTTIKLLSI